MKVEDIDPDSHDGSYELIRETINIYSTLEASNFNIEDLDMIYSMAIGTWKIGVSNKMQRIDNSNLSDIGKERLKSLLNKVIENAKNK